MERFGIMSSCLPLSLTEFTSYKSHMDMMISYMEIIKLFRCVFQKIVLFHVYYQIMCISTHTHTQPQGL